MKQYRILLVEDEHDIADLVKLNLENEGYKVSHARDGVEALQRIKEESFDLIIMDVMLPHVDGLTATENIRLNNAEVPILFLSARNTTQDRIAGLKKGGDDYLTKPFNLEELLLRVQKLIGRAAPKNENPFNLTEYKFGDNYVNFESFEAKGTQGNFMLTKKESMLLKLLIENKGQVVSREKILQTVWGYNVYPSTRTIDNFILAFRKYFEKDVKKPTFFQSMRGVGYKFNDVKSQSEG
ncbi:MAG: response regulator transcription factor [Bacteroidetes bacterium]|nr:response regulator transcription factor [Bacteroidota bacterium]